MLQSRVNFHVKSVSCIAILQSIQSRNPWLDLTCVLLPPCNAGKLGDGLVKKVIAALATRFNTTVKVIQQHVKEDQIQEWGKVRRTDGGDTMNSCQPMLE
jgi:hypothetical protein